MTRFRDDDRVTVTDTTSRHYNEVGVILTHQLSFNHGEPLWWVELDGREGEWFLGTQLELGDLSRA